MDLNGLFWPLNFLEALASFLAAFLTINVFFDVSFVFATDLELFMDKDFFVDFTDDDLADLA